MTRVFLTALIAVGVYLVFEFGRIQANYNIVDAGRERQVYDDRIATLDAEIVSLKQAVALLETHHDIDREAYKDVEVSLVALQAKIQEQTDAIAFYRGIVSPSDGAAILHAFNDQTDIPRHPAVMFQRLHQHQAHIVGSLRFGSCQSEVLHAEPCSAI